MIEWVGPTQHHDAYDANTIQTANGQPALPCRPARRIARSSIRHGECVFFGVKLELAQAVPRPWARCPIHRQCGGRSARLEHVDTWRSSESRCLRCAVHCHQLARRTLVLIERASRSRHGRSGLRWTPLCHPRPLRRRCPRVWCTNRSRCSWFFHHLEKTGKYAALGASIAR